MANYDVNVILKHQSNLPEDHYVNTLHLDVNAPDTLQGLCDDINAAYFVMNSAFSSEINGMDIKVYTPGPNPSGPVFQKSYANMTGGTGAGPSEIACCLSYATVDNPDNSLPRRRGRIYIGPFVGSHLSNSRPPANLRGAILTLGQGIGSAGNAGNTTWLMKSVADNSYHKIESIWVDDAWDVQRRRGLAPTLREVQDVQ